MSERKIPLSSETKISSKNPPKSDGAVTGYHFAPEALLARLPEVRGQFRPMADLSKTTWFRVGGPAEILFKPADQDDLADFLAQLPADIPCQTLGVGSNLLVRDGGIAGVVIRLGRSFHKCEIDQKTGRITAGAALLDAQLAAQAAQAGIGGLSFLAGIPGTIGGGLRMNAGAYGQEFKDVLSYAVAIDRQGVSHRLTPQDMGMSYRHSDVPADWIFVEAVFQGEVNANPEQLEEEIAEINRKREATQPIRQRTGGSTFANPEGHKAWQLIDQAGCRNLRYGDAQVSDLHCNFLINHGQARAADLENLGEDIRARVKANSGIMLRWEIRRIGLQQEEAVWPSSPGTPSPATSAPGASPESEAG